MFADLLYFPVIINCPTEEEEEEEEFIYNFCMYRIMQHVYNISVYRNWEIITWPGKVREFILIQKRTLLEIKIMDDFRLYSW